MIGARGSRRFGQRHLSTSTSTSTPSGSTSWVSRAAGRFYLVMAGINIGLVVADPSVYRPFADAGLLDLVRDTWHSVVMAHPAWWIGLLAAGEVAIGLAFLGGRSWRRSAYAAAVAFHLALLVFGWGVWLWAIPALVVLGSGARHEELFGRRTARRTADYADRDQDQVERALMSELNLKDRND